MERVTSKIWGSFGGEEKECSNPLYKKKQNNLERKYEDIENQNKKYLVRLQNCFSSFFLVGLDVI